MLHKPTIIDQHHDGSLSEQVCAGLQCWPPDVIGRGVGTRTWGRGTETWTGAFLYGGDLKPGDKESLYGEVQDIMDNGHMIPLWTNRHTHMTENITFLQLCWWMVNIFLYATVLTGSLRYAMMLSE